MKEHFETLAVDPKALRNCSHEEILDLLEGNYRALSRVFHPDTANGDVERFREIQAAIEALRSSDARLNQVIDFAASAFGGRLSELELLRRRYREVEHEIEHLEQSITVALKRLVRRGANDRKLIMEDGFPYKQRQLLVTADGRFFRINLERRKLRSLEMFKLVTLDPRAERLPQWCSSTNSRFDADKFVFECWFVDPDFQPRDLRNFEIFGTAVVRRGNKDSQYAQNVIDRRSRIFLLGEPEVSTIDLAELIPYSTGPDYRWIEDAVLLGQDQTTKLIQPMGRLVKGFW